MRQRWRHAGRLGADAPGQEASKFKVVLDLTTMKIASITCTN